MLVNLNPLFAKVNTCQSALDDIDDYWHFEAKLAIAIIEEDKVSLVIRGNSLVDQSSDFKDFLL